MKDKNIIKALECCGGESCLGCPYRGKCHQGNPMIREALDLITRQQSEIDSLKIFKGYAEKKASDYRTMRDKYLNAKTEAVKEFVARVKEFMHNKFKALDEYEFEYITERDIDNLVKEIGENNG